MREKEPATMEAYDLHLLESAFAASFGAFTSLAERLYAPASTALDHTALEDLIGAEGREVLRLLFQDHLDLRAVREREQLAQDSGRSPAPHPVDAAGTVHRRTETGHHRDLATVVGRVTVERAAHRAPGAANLYPADAQLNLPAGLHSHGLRKRVACEAARGSFDAACAAVTSSCGKVLAKRQAVQLVRGTAVDIDAFYQARVPEPCTAATLLVISVDGKGIVMRPEALRDETRKKAQAKGAGTYRTRLASGEKTGRKRMATVAAVYDTEPAVRRPHDVVALTGPAVPAAPRRPRPKAQAKWLAASLAKPAKQQIAEAFDRAEDRDPDHHRRWVVLVDGDRHQIEAIEAEAARRGVAIDIVVDVVHVAEYVWKAAWTFHPSGAPEAERWVGMQLLGILYGRLEETLAELHERAETAGLTNDQRAGLEACRKYLMAKKPYLDYPKALAAGWPIATGVVEGACRHLIADRLDITGARWGLEGAEAVLKLRAVISNGDFEEYWAFHLRQEYLRNHQARYQDGYRLAA